MDTTDPEIRFDAQGVCNHCHAYDEAIRRFVVTGEEGRRRLGVLVDGIKREGSGKRYDCIIGVSGGVDSTFVALQMRDLGLRPLAVHLDNGWDSELAVSNIHGALTRLKIDLHTHVIDWEEFKDLQLSFLRASTPDSEVPTDHAIYALMHRMADHFGVRYVITGVNRRTESHLPRSWSQGHFDWRYIKSVQRQFGRARLKTFPHMTHLQLSRWMKRHQRIDVLNYLDYVKRDAIPILESTLGWRNYGGKHYESIYTRFYQGYILPRKFGYDKRRTHLSSLVCSGEITRDAALAGLGSPSYDTAMQEQDRGYVLDKFGLTEAEFEEIMLLPHRTFDDYPSYGRFYRSRAYRLARDLYRLFWPALDAKRRPMPDTADAGRCVVPD